MRRDLTKHVRFSNSHLFYLSIDHFSKCNQYLIKKELEPIDWNVDSNGSENYVVQNEYENVENSIDEEMKEN